MLCLVYLNCHLHVLDCLFLALSYYALNSHFYFIEIVDIG